MIRKYWMPALALAGMAVASAVVWRDDEPMPPRHAALTVATSPFASQIAGTGIIEAGGGNIAVGTPVAGIIKHITVHWGQAVRSGDVLFQIDDADLRVHLPSAQAHIREAQAKLALSRNALTRVEHVSDPRAVSTEEVDNRRLTVNIDAAAVATAQASVAEIVLEQQRRIVRAPANGQVLQIRLHAGEYVDNTTPLMLLGDDRRRQVRADIDENDAARLRPEAKAVACARDDLTHCVALQFERIDPVIIPKAVLTGASAERVDTRVLQVIYSFDSRDLHAWVGQQVDVFIETSDRSAHTPTAATASRSVS